MSKLSLPDSVKTYFNEKPLQTSIDSLVDRLDGKKMPESDWEQARSYNQALLMAAQIRADYVELMFGLWEETFGNSAACDMGNPSPWDADPSSIWENDYLGCCFYREGRPEGEGKSDELYISFEDNFVRLEVFRNSNEETPLNFPKECNFKLWELNTKKDGHRYAHTKHISIKKFFANFDIEVANLRKASDEMVKYLLDR